MSAMTSMLSDLCVGRGPAGSWPYMLAQGSIWMLVGLWSLQATLGVFTVVVPRWRLTGLNRIFRRPSVIP